MSNSYSNILKNTIDKLKWNLKNVQVTHSRQENENRNNRKNKHK